MNDLLTLDEAAALLRRSPQQLRWMRHKRIGPPSAKIAGRVVYRRSEVETWVDEQFRADPTALAGRQNLA